MTTPTTPTTPTDVFTRALEHLRAHDMDAFTALFAPDAEMEFPFAPTGRPQRLRGRDQVAAYLQDYPDLLDIRRIHDVTLHQALEPTTLVAEFSASGTVVATRQPYTARYIAVLTVVDGLITRYRDYWNPVAFADIPVGAGVQA